MTELANDSGLVCGYSMDATGTMSAIKASDIGQYFDQPDNLVWLHFNHGDAAAHHWIAACQRIPAAAKSILLGADSHMRIEAVGDGLCGIIGDLHPEFADQSGLVNVLRLYIDNHCLISLHHRPVVGLERLRQNVADGLKDGRPIVLVTNFLLHVADILGELVSNLAANVDDVEERLLDERQTQPGDELSRVRRLAARLKRHMVPQQHALLMLLTKLPHWIGDADAVRLRGAIEGLGAIGHDLELVQERARLLQEQASARLMEISNRNLYILSIVTVLFLPVTLLGVIFGVNLGGLPWRQTPFGFVYGVLLMAAVMAATYALLRRRRMV